MVDKKRIDFIVNPISGGRAKEPIVEQIDTSLGNGFETAVHYTKSSQHTIELAENAIQKGCDALIAVGGDGSINALGKALLHKNIPLGIIPAGSGNGFARHMGIPLNIEKALERIKAWKPKLIDAAEVNKEAFFATLGIGFDAHVSAQFANSKQRGLKTYIKASLNTFLTYEPKEYTLWLDNKKHTHKAFLISVANVGQYGNNAWIAPNASVQDGLLNLVILEPFPKINFGKIGLQLFNKNLDQSSYYIEKLVKELTIECSGAYQVDGEPRKHHGLLEIKVLPNSLLVL